MTPHMLPWQNCVASRRFDHEFAKPVRALLGRTPCHESFLDAFSSELSELVRARDHRVMVMPERAVRATAESVALVVLLPPMAGRNGMHIVRLPRCSKRDAGRDLGSSALQPHASTPSTKH